MNWPCNTNLPSFPLGCISRFEVASTSLDTCNPPAAVWMGSYCMYSNQYSSSLLVAQPQTTPQYKPDDGASQLSHTKHTHTQQRGNSASRRIICASNAPTQKKRCAGEAN